MGRVVSRGLRFYSFLRVDDAVNRASVLDDPRYPFQSALSFEKEDESRAELAAASKNGELSFPDISRTTGALRLEGTDCLKILYLAVVVLQIVLLAYWSRTSHIKTNASIPNSVIRLGGILTIALLSYVEHHRTLRPSLLIEAYFFLTIIFDAARARTFWLIGTVNGTAAMTTVWLILKIVILVVEARSKQNILRPEYQSASPEAISGLCSKMVFWWLNPLFRAGYSKTLSLNDLLPLDKHLTSNYLYHKLRTTANSLKSRGSNALLKRYLGTLRGHLFAIVPPRLALIGFNFCQPFLIERTISFSEQSASESPKHIGYGLIGAYFIVYCGIAMTTGQYQHLTYRAITMARGGLVSNIFAKTSLLKANGVDPASSITLMSADIERITNGWQLMNEMWANVIEIAIAIYLLALQLGVACVVPLAVAIGKPPTALLS